MPQVKCVDTKFVLEGQKIRKADLQRYAIIDEKMTKDERREQEREATRREREEAEREKQEELRAEKQREAEAKILQARAFEEARQREDNDDDDDGSGDSDFWGNDDDKSCFKNGPTSGKADHGKDPHWTTILKKVPVQGAGF